MHLITHLIKSIKGKGVTMNESMDGGEALHPQMRRHWQRSNHQPDTAEDQVSDSNQPLVHTDTLSVDASDGVQEGGHTQHLPLH